MDLGSVSPSILEARFTVSPTALNSTRRLLPRVPTTTGPEWMPILILRGGMPVALLSELVVELGHLPVNRQGGSDCPLRCVLQGDRSPEQGHDPVPGHLVDRAFVLMNSIR